MSEPSEQAAKILGPLSGTVTVWALDLGLRLGVFEYLADRSAGATAGDVADDLGLDPRYTHVILRAAYAAEVLELDDGHYRLAEHMAVLMPDADAVVPRLPAVTASLERGARYLDLACGLCRGPAKVASAFPRTTVTAVDGDLYTLGAVERAHAALDRGGTFLVSEFPFPEREEDCRSAAGRLMCGVQFFEAHIGCQLLPTARFVDLLERGGFRDVGVVEVTPVHVVVHGTK